MREIFGTVCFVGAIQTILLFFVLIIKRQNHRANIFLSVYIFFTAVDVFELYLGTRDIVFPVRAYQLSIVPYSFIFGPSIYLYSAVLTAQINPFLKKYLFLYVPAALIFAVNILFLFTFRTSLFPDIIKYIDIAINGGGLIFELILYLLSFVIIQKYIIKLKEYFSAIDILKLTLFRSALIILSIVIIFIFISLFRGGHIRFEYKLLDLIAIIISLGLGIGLVFTAMIQPDIFNRITLINKALTPDSTTLPRYEKLRLPSSKEELYVKKLQDYMTEKKPYLREELTIQDLATELSISTHHISMILNIHFKQNFYNFINSYRVEEVKEKLIHGDYADHNILSIAFSAGFNSKSTFNIMFKKFTGKTPKEFRSGLSILKSRL
jgi:AraC-like DNA-binding protein